MKNKIILIIMLSSILNFFGCNNKKKISESSNSNTVTNEEISQTLDDFMKRPIHKELTIDIIDSTKDDDLIQTVFDNLAEKIGDNYEKEYKIITGLSKERQAIYTIWLVDAEVNNGGFNQFYFNSSGQFAELATGGFKLIGAVKFAELMQKANTIFIKGNKKITEKQDGSLEGFSESYEDNPLNELDSEFYDLYQNEDLNKLQVNFIRNNKDKFIDK